MFSDLPAVSLCGATVGVVPGEHARLDAGLPAQVDGGRVRYLGTAAREAALSLHELEHRSESNPGRPDLVPQQRRLVAAQPHQRAAGEHRPDHRPDEERCEPLGGGLARSRTLTTRDGPGVGAGAVGRTERPVSPAAKHQNTLQRGLRDGWQAFTGTIKVLGVVLPFAVPAAAPWWPVLRPVRQFAGSARGDQPGPATPATVAAATAPRGLRRTRVAPRKRCPAPTEGTVPARCRGRRPH